MLMVGQFPVSDNPVTASMDRRDPRAQNALMPRLLIILILAFCADFLAGQQPAPPSPKSETTDLTAGVPSFDAATMAAAVRGSYYHPDKMSGLNCTISVDWPAFFSALKQNPAADRLKAIQDLKIKTQAAREKKPEVTFEWAGGALNNKEQFEDGLKEMLGGFYQIYWSMVASSPVDSAAEITKIEPLPNGEVKVYFSSPNTNLVITADRERTPTHYRLDSPAMNGTIDLRYVASPKPVPGDLRRISSMDLSEQIGNSTMNVTLDLDYQAVDEFYIPKHVSFGIAGAYSLSMDLSGCSVSKGAIAHK
jgi:hypothetical protein